MSGERSGMSVLARPVRLRVVGHYAGDLTLALGVLGLAPVIVAVACGEWGQAPVYLGLSLGLVAIGAALRRLPAAHDLRANEAMLAPTLLFLLTPPLLAIPLIARGVPPIDALFECVSAITTTGLSTLASVGEQSSTALFARAWTQWIGGLGVLVLVLALFVLPSEATRRFGSQNMRPSERVQSARTHAKYLLGVYCASTAVGIVGLLACGVGSFDATVHALAAVSTGGFSSHDQSLGALGWPAAVVVLGLCFAGALPLALYAPLRGSSALRMLRGPEVRGLALAIAGVFGLLLVSSWARTDTVYSTGDLLAFAVSAQTTAGFSTISPLDLDAAEQLVIVLAMGVGGEIGSTAGGVKLLRLVILWRLLHDAVRRLSLPTHAYSAPHLRGRLLDDSEAIAALTLIGLFVAVALLSWLPFLVAQYDPMDSLFEVVSALGTVGLSAGIAQPGLEPGLKGVLCMDMWLGRLEILPLLLLLDPRAWRRHASSGGAAEAVREPEV